MHLSISSLRAGGGGRGEGHWAGIWSIALARGHLNYLAVPGVGIFEFLQTFDHKLFPGVRNFSYI